MDSPYSEEFRTRFWSHVTIVESENCWIWAASTSKGGYGQVKIRERRSNMRAHRVAWELTNGPIPDGLCILHRCDVPRCVNPGHLFVGTIGDNNRDMATKGRNVMQQPGGPVTGDNHWSHRNPEKVTRGEKVHTAILTAEQVKTIRERHAKGEKQSAIAHAYGVSKYVINGAVLRRTWKSI